MVQEILNKEVTVEFIDNQNKAHYVVTPYSFQPRVGNKLVSNSYVDMGQGLIECLHEIHSELGMNRPKERNVPNEVTAQGPSR
jgi:UDP-glucose 4-epimerase